MFVDDVTLELGGRDDVAIPKLKVFDEETCTVERLLAANAVTFWSTLWLSSMWRLKPDVLLNSSPQTRHA
jgi:hypothetical protein